MQEVLHFTRDKKKYVSKPWDFEAFTRVHEHFVDGGTKGVPKMCSDAVDYLFEGTQATQDILDADHAVKFALCNEVWKWFNDDLKAIMEKNSQAPEAETEQGA